jgi:transposase InsO family protein
MIDPVAKEIAVRRYGLPECLHVPIAAVDEAAITAYVGTIQRVLSGGSARRAFLVLANAPPARDMRLPIWNVGGCDMLDRRLPVWVDASYTRYLHIDIAEVQTAEGKIYLYVAIDRTSKFTVIQLVKKTGRTSASAFLERVIEAFPYKIHTVLTDNGIQFTFPPRYADGPTARYVTHMFDMRCRENGIEHRLTKVKHPWTNGQVERMNRTIKEATVKRYHYDSHQQLDAHLSVFIDAYNYGRRLKTLKGLTPYEFICKMWTKEPQRFRLNPIHQNPGLNT